MERLRDLEIEELNKAINKMKEELRGQNVQMEEKNQEIKRLNEEITKTTAEMENDVKEKIE